MKGFCSILLLLTCSGCSRACKGCVNLDEHSFEKVVAKFEATLVKFDVVYPYGEKHNVFSALAEELAGNDRLLFAQVGVKDYGDRENERLAKKYDVKDKDDIPAVRLFLGDVEKAVEFPREADFTIVNLRNFLRDNVDVYVGLPGCLKEYDEIAVGFADGDGKESKLKDAEKLKEKLEKDEEKSSADVYVKFMKKIIEKGASFVRNEADRLSKILKEGKVNEKKKQELSNHLNILHSFSVKKDEL